MYLKSLELQGFKSFPDKVKLTFDKGLTGVVGPNGSGKSNIGDAVRWVLGEQSTKTLRGSKMEDVIFSGTKERKPVGYASVTLVIDNSSGKLPIDAEEVSVNRKIYRSGESEYRINGNNVRLKDINELFMDTGLGRDGYSIIGQGRIAEIVGAKSSERRDIFEEAAGVSKFRYRKCEAEKKLMSANDNLLRLSDIAAELSSRVGPLKIQSEKAQKFLELSERKKAVEISLWVKSLDKMKINIDEIRSKTEIADSQYKSAEFAIETIESQIKKINENISLSEQKSEQLKTEVSALKEDISSKESDIAVWENDITHSEKNIENLERRIASEKSVNDLTEQRIKESVDALEEITSSIENTQSEMQKVSEEFGKIDTEMSTLSKDCDDVSSNINTLFIKQSELKVTVSSAQQSSDRFSEMLNQYSVQKEKISNAADTYRQELDTIQKSLSDTEKNLEETENKLSGYINLYNVKNDRLSNELKKYELAVFDIKDCTQRKAMLEELEKSMEGFNHSVKVVMKEAEKGRIKGISGTVAGILSTQGEYALAIETALGATLQNIVTEDENVAKRCINLLKEKKSGRATFLPLTSIKGQVFPEKLIDELSEEDGFIAPAYELVRAEEKFENIINYLLGKIAIADDLESASAIAKKFGYRFKIVTLDGQVVNAGGSFTGGSASHSAGVLTRKADIEKYRKNIIEYEKIKSELKESADKLSAETQKIKSDMEKLKEDKIHSENDKIRFQSENMRITSFLKQSELQLSEIEENITSTKNKITENLDNIKKSQDLLIKIQNDISELEITLKDSLSQKDKVQSSRQTLSERISRLKLCELEFSKDKESIEKELDILRKSIEEFSVRKDTLSEEIQNEKLHINQKLSSVKENRAAIENISAIVSDKITQIQNIAENIKVLHSQSDESAVCLKEKNADKENISGEIIRLDERRCSMQKSYDSIISQMWEEYELTRSEAQEICIEIEDVKAAERNLVVIKNDIKSLGSINVSAIEEYKEVSERYEFMSAQLKDINDSKRELEKLILQLTEDMKMAFSECFEKINHNFSEIFTDLFGGGTGQLVLTEPDDVLNSGIEINVAPPGKVIKNLISLSGGEQAFIAIAIYFAILKIKPSPFCILDEIDAALDESNVRKYAEYLRNFTDTTQFILVTHRRGTMETANVLYGVTMQENGVSKLLRMEQPQ